MHGAKSERGEGEKATMCGRRGDRETDIVQLIGQFKKDRWARAHQRQRHESGIHVVIPDGERLLGENVAKLGQNLEAGAGGPLRCGFKSS